MDTTAVEIGQFDFTGITAHDIFVGEFGWGFLLAALFVAFLGFLGRKYTRFINAVETIKDFDWKYWLADNAVNLVVGFPIAWFSIRGIDLTAPMILNSEIVMKFIDHPERIPVEIVVVIVSFGIGWLIDKYVPSPSIEKLLDPNK